MYASIKEIAVFDKYLIADKLTNWLITDLISWFDQLIVLGGCKKVFDTLFNTFS